MTRKDHANGWACWDCLRKDHANGWACWDCLMLLANGETPPEMTEEETAEYLARVDAQCDGSDVTLGRMFGEDGCEHSHEDWDTSDEEHSEQCERLDFSWVRCDVCGSTLGGSRDAVTFWFDAES